MKQNLNSNRPVFTGIIALVVGLLIAFNPVESINFTICAVGVVMFIFGTVEIISALVKSKRNNLPLGFSFFAAIVVAVLGILIFFRPEALVSFFMYLIGIGVVILGVSQIITLSRVRKAGAEFSSAFYLFPVFLSVSGIFMLFFPVVSSAWIVVFAGVWIALYGASEIFGKFAIKVPEIKIDNNEIIEAEVVEDDK